MHAPQGQEDGDHPLGITVLLFLDQRLFKAASGAVEISAVQEDFTAKVGTGMCAIGGHGSSAERSRIYSLPETRVKSGVDRVRASIRKKNRERKTASEYYLPIAHFLRRLFYFHAYPTA
jgi:hypothetical protein